jgi:hypothetical protein
MTIALAMTSCGALSLSTVAFADGQAVVLTAGGDMDDEEGYRLDLGLAWMPGSRTTVTVLGSRANTSTDFNEFRSSAASLGIDHSFGTFGLAADASWWGDSDVVEARALGIALYADLAQWRLSARAGMRKSDFEPFDFDTVVPVRTPDGIVLVPISGTADCDLDNRAWGLSLGRSGASWGFSLGATSYDYDETSCATRNVVVPPQIGGLPPISREIFRRIAARVVDRTASLVGTRLTRENGFLESTVNAGLSYTAGEWSWAADYYHDREEFLGLESDTLVGSVTLPIAGRADLELRAGATDTDLAGTIGFAGLTFYLYLGGGE